MKRFADGNFFCAESSAASATSQTATMFSLLPTSPMLLPPRPPAPMMAMFSLLLRFCPRRKAGATRVPSAELASSLENCRRDNSLDTGDEDENGFVFMCFAEFYLGAL